MLSGRFKFGFVVLNYNSLEYAIECMRSISRLPYENKEIIFVDNASDNQKGILRRLKEVSIQNLTVLFSHVNLGYARGNNIGIRYARKRLHCDFICLINPDARIESVSFIEQFIGEFDNYGYAVAGPQIIDKAGNNRNPLGGYHSSIIVWVCAIFGCLRIYLIKKILLSKPAIFKIKRKIGRKRNKRRYTPKTQGIGTHILGNNSDKTVSGACLVLSPAFFRTCSGLCDKTFLYSEEYILTYACHGLGLKILYVDEIRVFHAGGRSSESLDGNQDERIMFMHLHAAKSALAMVQIMLYRKDRDSYIRILTPKVDRCTRVMGKDI